MTTSKSSPFYWILTSLLFLALACFSFVRLCTWVLACCFDTTFFKQLLLITVILAIGLITLSRQIWRTTRYTRQLLDSAQVALPVPIRALIASFGLDVSHIVLIQSTQPLIFCYGFLQPRICLSTGLVDFLSTKQLQAAFQHEDYHRQQWDPLRILLVEMVSAMLFFLPVIRDWCAAFKIKLELDADSYAARKTSKAALAGALHQMLTYAASSDPIPELATARLSANNARIAALLGDRSLIERISVKRFLVSTLIIWILCVVLML